MEREEVVSLLKKAQNEEEKVVPILIKHLDSAIFWTGIPQDRVEKAKGLLKGLADDSARHRDMIVNLIREIEEGR
jgi:hypothetical protein